MTDGRDTADRLTWQITDEWREFAFREKDVADATGIHQKKLRTTRQALGLVEDRAYTIEKKAVVYSRQGVLLLLGDLLPLKMADGKRVLPARVENLVPGPQSGQPVDVRQAVLVFEKGTRNPRLAFCYLANADGTATGEPQRVLMRDHANFRKGMKLTGVYAHDDVWHMKGRGPRWPGRW